MGFGPICFALMLFRWISFEKHEPFLLNCPKDPLSLPTLLTHEHSMLPNPFPWWRAGAKPALIHGEEKLGHATESNHIIIPCWWRWAQQCQRRRPWPPLKPASHAETVVRFRRERPVYISYHVRSPPPANSCPLLPTPEGRSAASFKVGQVLAPPQACRDQMSTLASSTCGSCHLAGSCSRPPTQGCPWTGQIQAPPLPPSMVVSPFLGHRAPLQQHGDTFWFMEECKERGG